MYKILTIIWLVVLMTMFGVGNKAAASTGIFFEYPEIDQILNKDDRINITGYTSIPTDTIEKAEISFDGFVWRQLTPDASFNDGLFHFNYGWMVAGKGKSFIMVKLTLKDGSVLEDRRRYEVTIPPGKEDPSVRKLLEEIYSEQEKQRQAEQEIKPSPSLWILASNYLENNIGSDLSDNYSMFLPSKTQFNFLLRGLYASIDFIRTYEAGVDILMFLIQPYLVFISLLLGWFIILKNIALITSILSLWIDQLNRPKNPNFFGLVFDINDLHKVSLAKVSLRNNQTGETVMAITNLDGEFKTRLDHGEYSYEIEKNNYRNYVDVESELSEYLSYPVARGTMMVNSGNRYALPTTSHLSLTRWNLHLKNNWGYKIQYLVLNNMTALVGISYLTMTLWLLFVKNDQIWIYLIIISLAYIIYLLLERQHNSSGIVYYPGGQKAGLINLILQKNGVDELSVWSNFEGKYKFGFIPDGTYTLRVNDNLFEIDNLSENYRGGEFVIDRQRSCSLPINIQLRKKPTR